MLGAQESVQSMNRLVGQQASSVKDGSKNSGTHNSQSHKLLKTGSYGKMNTSSEAAHAYQIQGSSAKQPSPLKKQSSLKKFD